MYIVTIRSLKESSADHAGERQDAITVAAHSAVHTWSPLYSFRGSACHGTHRVPLPLPSKTKGCLEQEVFSNGRQDSAIDEMRFSSLSPPRKIFSGVAGKYFYPRSSTQHSVCGV